MGFPGGCGPTAGTPCCSPVSGVGSADLSGWWKLAAAPAVAEAVPGRRAVWIGADLGVRAEDTSEWLAANGHVLVVAPDFVVGLTHEDWTGWRRGSAPRADRDSQEVAVFWRSAADHGRTRALGLL